MLTLHHAKLIMGFTHQTLTESEHDELDEWICETDENLEIFEELLDTVDSRRLSMDEIVVATEDMLNLWEVAGLIARELQGIIGKDERRDLDVWASISTRHKKLYRILRNPANLQQMVLHLLKDVDKTSSVQGMFLNRY